MTYDVDMVAAEVDQLVLQAEQTQGAARVALLASAADLAIDPLRRIELLMLVADAAGRAAHQEVSLARRGINRGAPATYEQIGRAARLGRDVVYRQHTHGAALSWPARARGVDNGRSASRQEPSGQAEGEVPHSE